MATLLTLHFPDGIARDTGEEPNRSVRAGSLDPLSVAWYRWRIISHQYDEAKVLDVLANRVVDEVLHA